MSSIIRSLLIRVGVDLKDQQKGLTAAAANMKAFGRNATKIGASLTKGLTVPILAIGAMSLKSAIDFESAFAGVRKTVDATDEQFAALERGIRNMSKEIPAAATDIAAVAEAAGQLGIQTDNILGFTRVMVDLGEATNMTATEGAETLAKFANITQMSQKDFDRLGSSIVALGNSTATTEADIANMSMRLAGAGKQVGMTEPQILGFAAALSSVGIEAEAGGSAMSKVMVEMQLAASKGGESLQQFADVAGMTAAEFKEAYQRDAAGALTAFIKGLGSMKAQGKDAIVVLDDMGITEVRMRDALLRAANAGDLFTDTIKISTGAWQDNVALTNEAAQRYDTTESQLRILLNRLVDLGRTLGNSLIPVLRNSLMPAMEGVVRALGSVLDGFNNLSPFMQNFIIMTAGVAASIGPVMTVLGKLSFSLADTTKGLGAAVKIIEGGGGFKAALTALLGPAGMAAVAIAGVALAIGGAIVIFQEQNKEQIEYRKRCDELIATSRALRTSIMEQNDAYEVGTAVARKLTDELDELNRKENKTGAEKARLEAIVRELNLSYEGLNLAIDEETGLLNKSKSATEAYITAKGEQLRAQAQQEKYLQLLRQQAELEVEIAIAQKRAAEEKASGKYMYEWESDVGWKNLQKELDAVGKTLEIFEDAYATTTDSVVANSQEMVGAIIEGTETQQKALDDAQTAHAQYFEDMEDATRKNLDAMGGFYSKGIELNKTSADEIAKNFREQARQMREWTDEISKLAPKVPEALLRELYALGPAATLAIRDLNGMTSTELAGWITSWADTGFAAAEGAKWAISRGLTGTYSEGYQAGSSIMDGLAAGINDRAAYAIEEARKKTERIMNTIKTRVQPGSPSKVTTEWGRNIMQGFSKGMGEALSRATQGARDATTRLMGSIGNAIGGTALQMPRLATAGNYAAPPLSSGGYAASTDDLAADGMASAFVRALQQYGLKVDANGRVIGQIASEYIEAERRNTTLGRGGVL